MGWVGLGSVGLNDVSLHWKNAVYRTVRTGAILVRSVEAVRSIVVCCYGSTSTVRSL